MKPLWLTMVDEKFWPMANAHFIASFNALGMQDDFEFQISASQEAFGDFGEEDYNASYRREMTLVRELIAVNMGRVIVWSDIDLRFYQNIAADIMAKSEEKDIWTMIDRVGDSPVRCTGLQFFKCTPNVLRFYDEWIETNNQPQWWRHAQESFNSTLDRAGAQYLSIGSLDSTYWTVGLGDLVEFPWRAGDPIPELPVGLKVHHANFTMGIENKMALLEAVQKQYGNQN